MPLVRMSCRMQNLLELVKITAKRILHQVAFTAATICYKYMECINKIYEKKYQQ